MEIVNIGNYKIWKLYKFNKIILNYKIFLFFDVIF